MHYTAWLASATLFTTSVSAFYPFNGNPSSVEDSADIVSLSDDSEEDKDGRMPTIDIKKRRTNVRHILGASSLPKSNL
jgi:hypothetical protein